MSNFEDLGKRGKEQQPHNRTSAHDNPDATDAASTHSDNNEQAQSQAAIDPLVIKVLEELRISYTIKADPNPRSSHVCRGTFDDLLETVNESAPHTELNPQDGTPKDSAS